MTEMMHDVMNQVASGQPLTQAQLGWLLETKDLVQLGMVGAEVRASRVGTQGTFVRVDTVPVEQAVAWDIAPEAGEVRVTGVPASRDAAVAAVSALCVRAEVPVTGFTVHDLALAAGPALRDWCTALRDAGLTGIVSARVDRLDDEWLEAIVASGLRVHNVAPGTPAEGEPLAALLRQVREWQARYDVFVAWQPLAVEVPKSDPSTGYDDMRAVVAARVLLDNVTHVQVDWGRAGAKLAQACLLFGADDLDAVPARDDMPHGPRRSVLEEVRRNIVAAGLAPVERTATFDVRAPQAASGSLA